MNGRKMRHTIAGVKLSTHGPAGQSGEEKRDKAENAEAVCILWLIGGGQRWMKRGAG